jgi:hypothetical protein
MSDLEGKQPGKMSAASSASGGGSMGTPGKQTLTGQLKPLAPSSLTGDAWIDRGAACDQDAGDGCFLVDGQRMRLMVSLGERVQTAQTNYKFALTELRVDQLMKKEDDLNWVVGLALDVVGAHFLKVGLEILKNARAAGIEHLGAMVENKWAHRGDGLLHAITEEKLGEYAGKAFGKVQSKSEKALEKVHNRAAESDKEESISYIHELVEQCDQGFQRFLANARATSNDAELLVLHDEMDASNHTVGAYKDELSKKIARFTKSGVNEIGSKVTGDHMAHHEAVLRSTRVVWVRDPVGYGKTLWYQSADDAAYNKAPSKKFDAEMPFGAPELERRVPQEFVDVALAKSEERWGETPTISNPTQDVMPSLNVPRLQLGKKGTP